MSYNQEVFNLYKTLDYALKRLAKFPQGISGIAAYIQVLPADRSGQLDQIRKWRNTSPGHGVGPQALAPVEWVYFLKNEIRCVECGGETLRQRLVSASKEISRKRAERANGNTPHTNHNAPAKSKNVYTDNVNNFHAEIELRDGRGYFIEKHIFHPDKKLLDFGLLFSFRGKIKKYRVDILTRNGWVNLDLDANQLNSIKINQNKMTGNTVNVRLTFEYKIGFFETKQGHLTVQRVFHQ